MGQPMPHHLEKGIYFVEIEELYNSPPGGGSGTYTEQLVRHRKQMIKNMESSGVPFGTEFAKSLRDEFPDVAGKLSPNYMAAEHHIQWDWFSRTPMRTSDDPQTPAFVTRATLPPDINNLSDSLDAWHNYWGDIEGIVYRTLREALYRSIGLSRADFTPGDAGFGQALDAADGQACWPIELLRICGPAWFEGWVTWAKKDWAKDGHVLAVFVTPNSHHAANPSVTPVPGLVSAKNEGRTLVTHKDHTGYFGTGGITSLLDVNGDPLMEFHGLTVAPAWADVHSLPQGLTDWAILEAIWEALATGVVPPWLDLDVSQLDPDDLYITDDNIYAVPPED